MMLFYQALLRLYPRSFRAEYGAEMTKDFAREWSAARPGGSLPLAMRVVADTIVNAWHAHLDIATQDVRHTIRSLARTPGFTLTAIVVAALGIGSTAATFSVADYVLLRPLPFPNRSGS